MLFAIKYRPRPGRTEMETQRLHELLLAWNPPDAVEIAHHFHYASGGGVVIVDTVDVTSLYGSVEPFKSLVEVDIDPVINMVDALATSLDIEEWMASVRSDVETRGDGDSFAG